MNHFIFFKNNLWWLSLHASQGNFTKSMDTIIYLIKVNGYSKTILIKASQLTILNQDCILFFIKTEFQSLTICNTCIHFIHRNCLRMPEIKRWTSKVMVTKQGISEGYLKDIVYPRELEFFCVKSRPASYYQLSWKFKKTIIYFPTNSWHRFVLAY